MKLDTGVKLNFESSTTQTNKVVGMIAEFPF